MKIIFEKSKQNKKNVIQQLYKKELTENLTKKCIKEKTKKNQKLCK